MISKILEGTIDYLKLINKEDLCLEFEEKKKAYTKLEAIMLIGLFMAVAIYNKLLMQVFGFINDK